MSKNSGTVAILLGTRNGAEYLSSNWILSESKRIKTGRSGPLMMVQRIRPAKSSVILLLRRRLTVVCFMDRNKASAPILCRWSQIRKSKQHTMLSPIRMMFGWRISWRGRLIGCKLSMKRYLRFIVRVRA